MLPNLKILICGVVFSLLLFAVTGAGVMLPDSYTRVGEVPQIGRPMMQRMIADEPAQAQFHDMTVARRSEELERLRERAEREVALAPAQPDPDPPQPSVVENQISEAIVATDAAPTLQPSEATGIASVTASGPAQVHTAEIGSDRSPDGAEPVQVAALPPPSADLAEQTPSLLKVPLPPPRPTAGVNDIHKRVFHRKHQVAQAQPDTVTFGQSLFLRRPSVPR